MRLKLLLAALIVWQAVMALTAGTEWKPAKPGVKQVQTSFASLRPAVTFKIGSTADWVLVTGDAVWVASSKPNTVQRIDPTRNKIVAGIDLPGEACSGLTFGFAGLWVPLCGDKPSLVRVDTHTNLIAGTGGRERPSARRSRLCHS
jgi:hypothetical protein